MKDKFFDPDALEPFTLSRSKVDLFLQCPCCFYLDRRLGAGRPPGHPFNINNAVDYLLKKEFDIYREQAKPHPIMEKHSIDAVPFQHELLNDWRTNQKGVRFFHKKTNFLLYGAIDDLWINPSEKLIVVDYKATSKKEALSLDAEWQIGYKRQMEFYQWLLRMQGHDVENTGYFVYCNGRKDVEQFNARLDFSISLLPYEGNDEWIEPELEKISTCLKSENIPDPNPKCLYCAYREKASNKNKEREIIYILTHEYMPGLVKIGRTTKTLEQRMSSLYSTSVPTPFECYYAALVDKASSVEKNLHYAFAGHRIAGNREFFTIDPSRVKAFLQMVSVKDLTLEADTSDDLELKTHTSNLAPFRFSLADIPIGAELQFVEDENLICRVIDDRSVEFQGEPTSLSAAALKILQEKNPKQKSARGPLYWLYKGETLCERRQRIEADSGPLERA